MCHLCEGSHSRLSRRHLLGAGFALAGVAAAAGLSPAPALAQAAPGAPNAISPDAALSRILEGNTRYVANAPVNNDYSTGRIARAQAQFPIAAIVSCADSRVAPEATFDQGPGELFVVRVAGNFVNEDGLASLEFGTKILGVPLIMVLGHSGCGAIAATIKVIEEGAQLPGHLPGLVNALKPGVAAAIAKKPQDLLVEATKENVRHNVQGLQAAQPIIKDLVSAGKVKVVGGYYDIATGKVSLV
jgi:carbonic anhydrase